MSEELKKISKEIGSKMAFDLYKSRESEEEVGAEQTKEFLSKNIKYKITVTAFWEKSRHYGYKTEEIENSKNVIFEDCISF